MIYWIIGIVVAASIVGFVYWIYRQGKLVAKSEELARRVTAGEIIAKKKNSYIRDVDKLVAASKEYDAKISEEFNRRGGPSAANVVLILESVINDTTPHKPKDAA
jgi:hypothetical protein